MSEAALLWRAASFANTVYCVRVGLFTGWDDGELLFSFG